MFLLSIYLKGWLTGFFLGLIVFMGCSLACVHACFFLKTHYFSHNLPLFHTSLSLLWQTPRFISWFYEAPPSEIRDGLRLVSWLSVLWFAKPPLRPAPQLSGMRSGWIVNSGVVYNAYQFEPDWDPEDISEEDRAEPVQARLLMVCLVVVVSYF